MAIEAIPTGALSLDLALGIGGLPRGRITEIYGPESSGKSTLALHVVAEAQRNGGICAYIDAEHALDPVYARAIGVDIDELLISQPDTGEQALEITDMLVRSGAIDVVVIDSVAALTPRAEIEGEMGDTHVGLQARLMSQALRKLTGNLNKSDTIAIFINQLREKIGVMFGCFSYGTRVTLADGTQEKIGKIVNQKLAGRGAFLRRRPRRRRVPKRVVNWFDNGRTDHFLQFTVAKPAGNGRAQFACTPQPPDSHSGGLARGRGARGRRPGAAVGHRTTCPTSSGRSSSAASWATARSRRADRAWRTVPLGSWRQAGRLRRLEGIALRELARQPLDQCEGCGLPRRPAAARAGRAPPGGLCRGQEGPQRRLPEAAHAAVAGGLVHGRRVASHSGSKGVQARTVDGSGRSEICVQACRSDQPGAARATTSPTPGASRPG